MDQNQKKLFNIALFIGLLFAFYAIFSSKNEDAGAKRDNLVSYSEFMKMVKDQRLTHIYLPSSTEEKLVGTQLDGKKVTAFAPISDVFMISDFLKSENIQVERAPEVPNPFISKLIDWFPTFLLIGVWIFMMRKVGGSGLLNGKSKVMTDGETPDVTFQDVAGCDEAKYEVQEAVDFLKNPDAFLAMGADIPRGLLMAGDPGSGKTLLAKAMAGEAGVPFISSSGSDFVEIFAGMGARKVREMFQNARKHAPCILFIDEIDAVGKSRSTNLSGNDEREQTLNQILVEMDGFAESAGVLVIAATNRPELLDPALVRPGRFSRHVFIGRPDIRGREQILAVHKRLSEKKKASFAADVDLSIIARGTPGFSGADLANLVNEAKMFSIRSKKKQVDMADFEKAKDKVMMGAERKSMIMSEEERLNTAYHESGHAVVAHYVPKSDPVHKVTIIPHGQALGLTMQLPEQDRYAYDRTYLMSRIAVLFGGRIAEELFMNQMTTGASNDFERATAMARDMVVKYGMSDLGIMVFNGDSENPAAAPSEATLQKVDAAVKDILEKQYALAKKILEDNRDKVEAMTQMLMKHESINAEQIATIMTL